MSISIPTDHEHWKPPVLLLGVALQAHVMYPSLSLSTCFSVLDIYEHLSLGTINKAVAESVCELSVHVHLKENISLLIELLAQRKGDIWAFPVLYSEING